MSFQVLGLPRGLYESYFQLSDDELSRLNMTRSQVTESNCIPCRVSLEDAEPGETVLLLNHAHMDEQSPYDSKYAIFVRERATEAALPVGTVPDHLQHRLLSVRGFSSEHHLKTAEVVEGPKLTPTIEKLLEETDVEYLHIHNAREGCYHAKVVRA